MRTDIHYFSGTGNSLYISKSIKDILEGHENEIVDLIPIGGLDLSKEVLSHADRIGLIYPTYDMDAPDIVKAFAKALRAKKNAYTFIYANSAGVPGNSVHTVKTILENNGITVSNAFSAFYPDNSVVYVTKSELQKKRFRESKAQHQIDADTIYHRISQQDHELFNFSRKSYLMGKTFDFVVKRYYGFKDIAADETCTSCGLCEQVCPVGNISVKNNAPEFHNECEMCFACIHACPKQSLRYKRMPKRDSFQYRHPEVTLNELTIYLPKPQIQH